VRVNGLYRHGFMIAPEVADVASCLAEALVSGDVADAGTFADFRGAARWPELLHGAFSVAPALSH
jgi:glycine oxidase